MANPILEHLRLSGTTYDLVDASAIHDLSDYSTTEQVNSAITAATNALAESIAEQGYQTSGDVQNAISGKADTTAVTQDIAAAVSGKADTTAVTQDIAAAVSGKVDTNTYTAYTASTETVLGTKFAGAEWDSNTSRINFYDNASNSGTPLAYVDGSDWVKDSFLKSVTIEDKQISGETVTCLVFVFETESGETETDIPLTDIFDPSNYYTKDDTDAAISAATSGKVDTNTYTAYTAATATVLEGKQDELTAGAGIEIDSANTISITGIPLTIDDTVTSGSSNPVKSSGIYNFVTGETATKQDTLVSGTNIKTINNTSILGSGNISTLPEVQGTTLIFS